MKLNEVSSNLIWTSMILIALTIILAALTYNTNDALKNDAYIINSAGIVRGSIQRLTKLELAGCEQTCKKVRNTISAHLNELIADQAEVDKNTRNKNTTIYAKKLVSLEQTWTQLNQLLEEHHKNPSQSLKEKIVQLSEQAWETADAAVLFTQVSTESKMGNLQLFYPIALLIVFINILTILIAYREVGNKLELLATSDNLTNLYNRHTFEQVLEDEVFRAERLLNDLCLLYMDIDHFKSINDTYGHPAGDKVLQELAAITKVSVRKIDSVARIGGEEFAIIVPDINTEQAKVLAEKIRIKIENHGFADNRHITISIGIACHIAGATKEIMISQADKALYKAKKTGRNKSLAFNELNSSD